MIDLRNYEHSKVLWRAVDRQDGKEVRGYRRTTKATGHMGVRSRWLPLGKDIETVLNYNIAG